jgi:hypothetical protein
VGQTRDSSEWCQQGAGAKFRARESDIESVQHRKPVDHLFGERLRESEAQICLAQLPRWRLD